MVMSVSTSPEEATPGMGGFAVYDLRGSGTNSSAILEFSFSPPVVGSTAGGGSDASTGPVITCCKFNHNSQVRRNGQAQNLYLITKLTGDYRVLLSGQSNR